MPDHPDFPAWPTRENGEPKQESELTDDEKRVQREAAERRLQSMHGARMSRPQVPGGQP